MFGRMGTRSAVPLDVRLEENRNRLTPRRHKLIETILERADETFFLSSRELAKLLDVDAATIVRTIQALGYDRFADFTADLRRYFLARITPYAVLKAETKKGRTVADHVTRSLDRDLDNVTKLKERLDTDGVTAGRHPESDIFLDDVTVSRRHAVFRRTSDGYLVADVGSLNGTYVNRDRIDEVLLSGGDEVQIGKYRLTYIERGP